MSLIKLKILSGLFRQPNIYRLLTACVLLLVIVLVLIEPVRLAEPDDWAYYYAAKNFSQGHLVINDQLHSQQVVEASQRGGQFVQ